MLAAGKDDLMPSSVRSLVVAAGLGYGGVVGWGSPIPSAASGVYVVSLNADPESMAGVLPSAPISPAGISELLYVRPELSVDGVPPDAEMLAGRVSEFWLPDENVLYIGLAGTSLADRVSAYYSTRLGRRSPHAGGWLIKLLANLDQLYVHYAPSDDPNRSENRMLQSFVSGVSWQGKRTLRDPDHPFPYANLEWPRGTRKAHGIRGATGPAKPGGQVRTVAASRASEIYSRPPSSSTDVAQINGFLQDELRRSERSEVPAVEAARWLDRAGLLRDSPIRPGLPLRNLLRVGLITGQRQEPNHRWFIDRVDR
jgi:hypothetical protein